MADLVVFLQSAHEIYCLYLIRLVRSSATLFKNAVEYRLAGDEEKAYTLYMKFLNIVTSE